MSDYNVNVIFCDDIRHEEGNKSSYMGVYTTSLGAKSYPIKLPKFCVCVSVVTQTDNTTHDCSVEFLINDDRYQLTNVPDDVLNRAQPGVNGLRHANLNFQFFPMDFSEESVFAVKIKFGDKPPITSELMVRAENSVTTH